ncbi:hypothetical protein B0H17DRAFT_1146267 [Mycena rosella]|uniref:Uncharacterized protein n=1 Tax=Mycena rosella TaxID=1033263 RepID=A0AAD7G4Q0_MYCRO|nr:hypothetical protein B0H17DRAFT_1146267 [Mycena rosella]
MNSNDDSGFGWAYIDETSGTIVWNDALHPANPDTFCVLDHEIVNRFLPEGEVAVTEMYFENAERLIKADQARELKYFRQRQEKKGKGTGAPDVYAKASKDNFARKRQLLLDAAAAAAVANAEKRAADAANAQAGPSNSKPL